MQTQVNLTPFTQMQVSMDGQESSQSHTTVTDGKSVATDHPVTFVSGLYRGSQLNWAVLTKEAYAIYMSVKKLSFYLIQADVLLKSNHLPLKVSPQEHTKLKSQQLGNETRVLQYPV